MNKLKYEKVNLENLEIAYQIQASEWPEERDYNNFVETAKLDDDKNVNFIVYCDNKPIGITGVYTEDMDKRTMWLNWYCVVPSARGKGFGKQILLDTIEYCKKFEDIDYFRIDTTFNIKRASSRLYLQVMDIIEKYTAEDDENYKSGNYICSKRLKPEIDYIPWNNKNLHLRDYYQSCKNYDIPKK